MSKLDLSNLRSMIRNEIKGMVDEDMLMGKPDLGEPYYIRRSDLEDMEYDDYEDYEDDYSDMSGCADHDHDMRNMMSAVLEEDCGCGSKPAGEDYSLDSMEMLSSMMGHDHHDHTKMHKHSHKGSSYMAKPQLAKIARYAHDLHSMIHEDEELQDWQESKIAQMAQMIGDVYHSIEYKKHIG